MYSCFFDSPTFFGILDLSGEDTEVKELFTDEEWCEMISDFSKTVTFHDINEQEEKLLYNLLDDIEKVNDRKIFVYITQFDVYLHLISRRSWQRSQMIWLPKSKNA